MMMLEPVETAQDLNVIFGIAYFVFTWLLFVKVFLCSNKASFESGTLKAQLEDQVLQTKYLQD